MSLGPGVRRANQAIHRTELMEARTAVQYFGELRRKFALAMDSEYVYLELQGGSMMTAEWMGLRCTARS